MVNLRPTEICSAHQFEGEKLFFSLGLGVASLVSDSSLTLLLKLFVDGVDVFDAPFIAENVRMPKLWCKLLRETFPKCLTLESITCASTVSSLCLYLHCKCTASQSRPWLLKLAVEGFTKSLVCCLSARCLCVGSYISQDCQLRFCPCPEISSCLWEDILEMLSTTSKYIVFSVNAVTMVLFLVIGLSFKINSIVFTECMWRN